MDYIIIKLKKIIIFSEASNLFTLLNIDIIII
jgi:hypothetical protein